jgi:hypothetical protein
MEDTNNLPYHLLFIVDVVAATVDVVAATVDVVVATVDIVVDIVVATVDVVDVVVVTQLRVKLTATKIPMSAATTKPTTMPRIIQNSLLLLFALRVSSDSGSDIVLVLFRFCFVIH